MPGEQVAWMWWVRVTSCRGHGKHEVQPLACKPQPVQTAIVSTLFIQLDLTKKKEKTFPSCWVKAQVGEDGKEGA